MPEFVNPFVGIVPTKRIDTRELTRALRLSLAAEEEAVHLYEALADATNNKLAKTVLQDIADEEKVHVGEFQRLLNILLEDEENWLAKGAEEVNEMAKEVEPATMEESSETKPIPTIGDMKK